MDWRERTLIVIAVLGFVLSAYMLFLHESGGSSFCSVSTTFDCDVVNRSIYAELFGIPVALLGMVFYVTVAAFIFADRTPWGREEPRLVALLFFLFALFGVLFSLYLTAIEAFKLHTYCPLCLLSAFFSVLIFTLVTWRWRDLAFAKY